jgi:hypothetical protein
MTYSLQSFECEAKLFASLLKPLGYRKRTVRVRVAEKVTLQDLNWSGGSRSEYHAMTIHGEALANTLHYSAMHPADNYAEGATIPLPAGAVMVRTGFFCGKESQATIYVNPADMPRLLPQGGSQS